MRSQNVCKLRLSALNFKSFSRSLEQFFLTVGQTNFGNKIPITHIIHWEKCFNLRLLIFKIFGIAIFVVKVKGQCIASHHFFLLKLEAVQLKDYFWCKYSLHIFFSDKPPGLPPSATPYTTSARNQAGFSAVSTASSVVSIANLHFLPVKTQTTLKSPLEGHNLGPFHKPEEFLGRAMDNLTHEDWETNVNGMIYE